MRLLTRLMAWILVTLVLVAASTVGLVVNTRSGPSLPDGDPDHAAVAFLSDQLHSQGAPDASFGVARDGQLTATGTIGDEVSPDTPFVIGSLSKSVTAMAVLQLVDAGEVDLDAPVTDYLPEFRTQGGDVSITVRHLLTQTSGLPTWAGHLHLTAPGTTLRERVAALADVPVATAPGTTFAYSNANYATLGLLIEEVAGQSYGDYVQAHIFAPLGMADSHADGAAAQRAGLHDGAQVWFGALVSVSAWTYPGALPDGYLVSTLEDLATLSEVQLTGAHEGTQILSEESVAQMHTAPEGVAPDDFYGLRYGLGSRVGEVSGTPVAGHEGELFTYRAELRLLPEDDAAVILLGGHNSIFVDLSQAALAAAPVVAGGPVPEVDTSYFTTYLVISSASVVALMVLLLASVRFVRRLRRLPRRVTERGVLRSAVAPGLARIGLAAGLYVATFLGLGSMSGLPGMMPLPMAFHGAPDVTVVVLLVIAYPLLSGLALLITGTVAQRSGPSRPGHGDSPIHSESSALALDPAMRHTD